VQQIAAGLQAFHRKEMLHQDLRPENLMIDRTGTLKLIDFGSVHVAGLAEAGLSERDPALAGTLQYLAPEYFVGTRRAWPRTLLAGGADLPDAQRPAALRPAGAPAAQPAGPGRPALHPAAPAPARLPAWLDTVLAKALHPQPRAGTRPCPSSPTHWPLRTHAGPSRPACR
jgi:serine/threonine protein kinase